MRIITPSVDVRTAKRVKARLDEIESRYYRRKEMTKCPKCKGRGRQFVAANQLTPTGTDIGKSGECSYCKGHGWMTQEEVERKKT